MARLVDEERARRLREGDELYTRYGMPLEAEYWGAFIATMPDGRTRREPTLQAVAEQVVRTFGHGAGAYVFTLGERAVGRRR